MKNERVNFCYRVPEKELRREVAENEKKKGREKKGERCGCVCDCPGEEKNLLKNRKTKQGEHAAA